MTTAARATRTPAVATPAPAPARAPGPAKAAAKPWAMSGPPLVGASALQQGAQPGEVDLSEGTLDPATVTLDAKGRAPARLGKLAAGEISLARTASGALRTTGRGSAIPLTLPALGPALAGRTVLVVVVTDNVISGYAALGSPDAFVARNDDTLLGLALKDPAAIGLAGMSRISPQSPTNRLEQGTLNLGADLAFTLGGWLTGRGSLALAGEHLSAEGEAAITLPGGSGTLKVAAAAGKELAGDASLRLARGKLTGAADARLRGPTLDVVGTATYAGDRLRGSLTVAAIDADTARTIHRQNPIPELSIEAASPKPGSRAFCGVGDLEVTLTEWLIGRAKVVVNSEGEATVQGEIVPPSEVVLFAQKDWVKRLGTVEARAPYGLPVIGNVFVFANVGLEALATLGPGTLQDIKLSGQYSTDRSVGRELDLRATLRIPAFAGLRVRAEGGAGAEILAHDVKTGVSVWGLAGVRGYAEATPAITYRSKDGGPGEFVLAGHLELAAQPFLALGGELFLAVESPALSPLPSERRTWPMSGIEYPLPGELGIAADVAHVLGSKTWPEVQISEVAFDASKFMADLLRPSPPSDKGKSQTKKAATWTEAAPSDTPTTHAPATHKTAPATKPKTASKSATTPAPKPTTASARRDARAAKRAAAKRATAAYVSHEGEWAPSAGVKGEGETMNKDQDQKTEVRRSVRMSGVEHTLYLKPAATPRLEMASHREPLSTKLERAAKALEPQAPTDRTAADKLQDLRAIGWAATELENGAKRPHVVLDHLAQWQIVCDWISEFGAKYKTQDLDQALSDVMAAALSVLHRVMTIDFQPHPTTGGGAIKEGDYSKKLKRTKYGEFIVAGVNSTWHHIYPRGRLRAHYWNISRYLHATHGHEADLAGVWLCHGAMVRMAASFNMTADGVLSYPADYYHKHGNGFVGVLEGLRHDNPHENPEPHKPWSMTAEAFKRPLDWGQALSALSDELERNRLGGLSATNLVNTASKIEGLANVVTSESKKLDGAEPHRTSEEWNVDWTFQGHENAPAPPTGPNGWGTNVVMYKLVWP